MNKKWNPDLLFAYILFAFGLALAEYTSEELVSMPGHLKRFGTGRPTQLVDETVGFPSVQDFFKNYVLESRPMLMKGAAKLSPAYESWKTDSYFLGLNLPADSEVNVETRKKENRTQRTMMLNFKDFIRTYNDTDQYMVDTVPAFLMDDVMVPGPLQCQQIIKQHIVEFVMWFSSGGTKSVVHTDSVDNLNCLYQGKKEFVLVDPAKYVDKVYLDHPEGAYSDIDVDRADYTKYPGLADVEYYTADMSPGDCLYIPFKWIHSVRSHERNIAVNIWWNSHQNRAIELEKCPKDMDTTLTLSSVELQGFQDVLDTVDSVREHFTSAVKMEKDLSFDRFLLVAAGDPRRLEEIEAGEEVFMLLEKIFDIFDKNGNGFISVKEIEKMDAREWNNVMNSMRKFEKVVHALEQRFEEEHPYDEEDEELDDEHHDEL